MFDLVYLVPTLESTAYEFCQLDALFLDDVILCEQIDDSIPSIGAQSSLCTGCQTLIAAIV
eukprot:6192185-Amphidinium_carterae.1